MALAIERSFWLNESIIKPAAEFEFITVTNVPIKG